MCIEYNLIEYVLILRVYRKLHYEYLHMCFPCKSFIVFFFLLIVSVSWHFNFAVLKVYLVIYSVQFSRSVVSDSLRPHESQHARPPCPSPTPGVHSNSSPLSWWCHPAISSSVIPFSSCPQSTPASGSFPMNQLITWGGQSIGVSALASVLPCYLLLKY